MVILQHSPDPLPASWWETHSPRILQSVFGLAVLELMPFSLGGVRPEEPKFKARNEMSSGVRVLRECCKLAELSARQMPDCLTV